MSYPYYDEYSTPPLIADAKVVSFVEQIIAWKQSNQLFYANDIYNMLIDHGLINLEEIKQSIEKVRKSNIQAKLPNNHI